MDIADRRRSPAMEVRCERRSFFFLLFFSYTTTEFVRTFLRALNTWGGHESMRAIKPVTAASVIKCACDCVRLIPASTTCGWTILGFPRVIDSMRGSTAATHHTHPLRWFTGKRRHGTTLREGSAINGDVCPWWRPRPAKAASHARTATPSGRTTQAQPWIYKE